MRCLIAASMIRGGAKPHASCEMRSGVNCPSLGFTANPFDFPNVGGWTVTPIVIETRRYYLQNRTGSCSRGGGFELDPPRLDVSTGWNGPLAHGVRRTRRKGLRLPVRTGVINPANCDLRRVVRQSVVHEVSFATCVVTATVISEAH